MKRNLFGILLLLMFGKFAFSQAGNTTIHPASPAVSSLLPIPDAAFTLSTDTICQGDSIVFTDISTNVPTSWLWTASSPSLATFNTSSSQNSVGTFPLAGTYTVYLTASNISGSDTDSLLVTVLPLPNVLVSGPVAVCGGDSVTLAASGALDYVWNTSQFLSDSLIASPVCTPTASVTYTVSGTDAFGCVATASVSVVFNALPVVSGSAGTPGFGVPASVVFSSAASGADSVVWNFGDASLTDTTANPVHTFTATGTYTVTLTAYNAGNCTSSTQFIVTINDASSLSIPNFFSPNYDDVNDVFRPAHTGIKDFYCVIYDRWGLKMYEWERVNGWWDGHTTAGVECSEGVYYYIMKATGLDGKAYESKGFIHLFR